MKGTLEFDLNDPDEKMEFTKITKIDDILSAVSGYSNLLRNYDKYSQAEQVFKDLIKSEKDLDLVFEVVSHLREKFYEAFLENDCSDYSY